MAQVTYKGFSGYRAPKSSIQHGGARAAPVVDDEEERRKKEADARKAEMQRKAESALTPADLQTKKAAPQVSAASKALAAYTVGRPQILAEQEFARRQQENPVVTKIRNIAEDVQARSVRLKGRSDSVSLTQLVFKKGEDSAGAVAGRGVRDALVDVGVGSAVGAADTAQLGARVVLMPKKTASALVAFGSQPASTRRAQVGGAVLRAVTEFSPTQGKPAFAIGRAAGSTGTFALSISGVRAGYQAVRATGTRVPSSAIGEAPTNQQGFPYTKQTAKELVREFYEGKAARTLKGIRTPEEGMTFGIHTTTSRFEKITEAGRGSSETAGLYIAPSTSEHFLRLGGAGVSKVSLTDVSLFPKFEPSNVIAIETKVSRIPAGSRTSFSAMQEFIERKAAGKGEAFISPAYEVGKRESEAIVPQGSVLVRQPEKFYTVMQGQRVRGEFFKAVAVEDLTPSSVKSAVRDFARSYSRNLRPSSSIVNPASLSGVTGIVRSSAESQRPTNYVLRSYTPRVIPVSLVIGNSNTSSSSQVIEVPDYVPPPISQKSGGSSSKGSRSTRSSSSGGGGSSTSVPSAPSAPPSVPSSVITTSSVPRAPPVTPPFLSGRRARDYDQPALKKKTVFKLAKPRKPVRYIPTVFSILGGVTAKKPTRFLTGLELRPVVKSRLAKPSGFGGGLRLGGLRL